MRRTKATLIYKRTKNLRAVQLLLGHTKLESTVRYLGIEVDDTLEISEQTENLAAPKRPRIFSAWPPSGIMLCALSRPIAGIYINPNERQVNSGKLTLNMRPQIYRRYVVLLFGT